MPDTPALYPSYLLRVELDETRDLGSTRAGHRRITPILGGWMREMGGELRARVLPGGADRQVVRIDGTVDIDARYTAERDDGSLIEIHATGIRRTDAAGLYFRVMVRFECSDGEGDPLQNALYIADGIRAEAAVLHTVYRVG